MDEHIALMYLYCVGESEEKERFGQQEEIVTLGCTFYTILATHSMCWITFTLISSQ